VIGPKGWETTNAKVPDAGSSTNRSVRQNEEDSLKTLQEPKTGSLEPFEIADVRPYLSLFQQLTNND
jgi:hypothetical protein